MENISTFQIFSTILLMSVFSIIIVMKMFQHYKQGKKDLLEDLLKNREITEDTYRKYS